MWPKQREMRQLPVPVERGKAGMKLFVSAAAAVAFVGGAGLVGYFGPVHLEARPPHAAISPESLSVVLRRTCGSCHNDARKIGDLTLQGFNVAEAAKSPEVSEKMIAKLRAGMMPPPGCARPGGDTLTQLVATLERIVDHAAAARPEPGGRTFQRLNRAEYERSIKELLTLDVNAGDWLPLDTKSANFDNIADVQTPSATLLDAYF